MRRILVGLDGSPRERGVLLVAQELSERYAAELILFRAVGVPAELPPEIYLDPVVSVLDVLTAKARAALESALQTLPASVRSRARLKLSIANPWRAVCSAAAEEQVDLIVVGSHGYGTLDHVLGTNAARIVNHAPCSVLVVRDGASSSPAAGSSS